MNETRDTYVEAAETAMELISRDETATMWNAESVLQGMTVGVLASHLARSVLQVEWFLDGVITGKNRPVTATIYYARLADTSSRTSTLNAGVEKRSAGTAAQGPDAIVRDARSALDRIRSRLTEEPVDRRVAVAHRPGEELLLDEYLLTRLVELPVHIEDLALSVGVDCTPPPGAVAAAIDLLVSAARSRHGDLAVLHALSRRERDDVEALRVI